MDLNWCGISPVASPFRHRLLQLLRHHSKQNQVCDLPLHSPLVTQSSVTPHQCRQRFPGLPSCSVCRAGAAHCCSTSRRGPELVRGHLGSDRDLYNPAEHRSDRAVSHRTSSGRNSCLLSLQLLCCSHRRSFRRQRPYTDLLCNRCPRPWALRCNTHGKLWPLGRSVPWYRSTRSALEKILERRKTFQ